MTAHAAQAVADAPARFAFGRVGLQAWVILFIGAAGTMLASTAQVRPIVHIVWVLPVLILAVRARPSLPVALTWSLAGVLVAYGLASFASREPWMSLETAGFAAAVAGWFVVAADMPAATRTYVARAVILALTAWLAVLSAVWSIDTATWVLAAGWPPPGEPTRNFVWLVGNSIPLVVLLALPFVRWLGSDPIDRWFPRAFLIAATPAVLLSGGVIGLAGVGIALGAYVAIGVMSAGRRALAVGAVVAIVSALVAALGAAVLGAEISLPSTAEARLLVWEQGARMLGSDPLTGTGPGTTALIRREFVEPHAAAVLTDHLHSAPIQAAAEGGVLLAGSLAVAAVTWGRALWTGKSHHADGARLVIACLAGASVSFVAESFLDLPVVVALAVTIAAWSVTPQAAVRSRTEATRRGPALAALHVAIASLALLSLAPVVSGDAARLAAAGGRSEARRDVWATALNRFELAVALNPANPLYRLEAGEAARELGETDRARGHFGAATAMAAGDGRTWGALASVTPDPSRRIALLMTAAERADGDPQFAFRLGAELENAGRVSEAADAYAEAVALQPGLIVALPERPADGVSRADVLQALPAVVARLAPIARVDAASTEWDLQLLTGALDPDAPPAWQAVAAAARGDLAASDAQLAAARERSPTDARTWQAAAAVARLRCAPAEEDAALRLERMLIGAHQFQSLARLRAWERVYREPGLGDYQPDGLVPGDERWPAPFVSLERRCP